MQNNGPFSFNFKDILLEEIALNGLEGIETEQLWLYLEKRIASPVTEKMKQRFWPFIVNAKDLSFFQLPEPLQPIKFIDRFSLIDEETGNLIDPVDCFDGYYEYHPIDKEYGSSIYYKTRKQIPANKLPLSYSEIKETFGNTLVIVASLELRWQALAPHMPITVLQQLTPVHYCILELIGKGRENGQMTVGNTNLQKIVKDPKLLFYNRNHLKKLDLITVQTHTVVTSVRGTKSLMLRLKRFHKPLIMSFPKKGKVRELADHLSTLPDCTERTDFIIKRGLGTSRMIKKLFKTSRYFIPSEKSVFSDQKKKNVKKRFITLRCPSDESSDSEEETEQPSRCQYKVGVNLLRQAYERFLEAGLNGLTQIELGQALGIEFYTTRTICRVFRAKKIVKEFLEDRGRQRTAKFIAVHATKEMDGKYEAEKKKFLEYLDESKNIEALDNEETTGDDKTAEETTFSDDDEVPRKKVKIEDDKTASEDTNTDIAKGEITEIKVSEGVEDNILFGSTKRTPTLRQLRYINGILKVLREKLAISGYHRLSLLVSREIGDSRMETKSLKIMIRKLATQGQLKLFKMNVQDLNQQNTLLICAPHVKATDRIVKDKLKELNMRAIKALTAKKVKSQPLEQNELLSLYVIPRFMRLQKLHEFLFQLTYCRDEKEPSGFPEGFSSLVHIIPEFKLSFALGNLSSVSLHDFAHIQVTEDMLNIKLKDAPTEIFSVFLACNNFQNSIRFSLKMLAMLGLIQLIRNPSQSEGDVQIHNNTFYVNRRASLLDTTGIWPRPNVDKESLKKSYQFNTPQDVEKYWADVYAISTKTCVDLKTGTRERKSIYPPLRAYAEVQTLDNGQVLGNGFGPCGFDACFFMEKPRLWSTYSSKMPNKKHMKPLKSLVIPKKSKVNEMKKAGTRKVSARKRQIASRPVTEEKQKRKRILNSDIPSWSREDDRVLMMCKVAITIMSPTSLPGCIRLRNQVARDIFSAFDRKKTCSLCHKRSMIIESNPSLTYEKDCILNELRHRRYLTEKYDGLLKVLRLRYSGNLTKLVLEARRPMLELVYLISKLTKSPDFNRNTPCIALNLKEFNSKFTISACSANKPYNLYRTPENEPQMAAVKEAIIMTVMMGFKREQTLANANKMYSLFSKYSEQMLRTALEQLRKCGGLAAKEKLLNNQMHKVHLQDILQESFKISMNYQRRWINRLNSEFLDKLMDSVHTPLTDKPIKGCPEINCLLSELQACNVLDIISVTVPVITGSSSIKQEEQMSVAEILMTLSMKSGACGWKSKTNVKTFSELYQDVDLQEHLASIVRNAEVRAPDFEHSATPTDEIILLHLKRKGEMGATFKELQELTGHNDEILKKKLEQFEIDKIIIRLGYFENIIVLTEFAQSWTVNIENVNVVPAPYITLNKHIRKDVLLTWAAVIMNKVFENPGSSISHLVDSCEVLTARAAQEICEFLKKCKCVKLCVLKTNKPDLFSEDEQIPELEDYNPFESVENITVYPVRDSLTRFASLKQDILDTIINDGN